MALLSTSTDITRHPNKKVIPYMRSVNAAGVRPSVRPSVRASVRASVRPSVRPRGLPGVLLTRVHASSGVHSGVIGRVFAHAEAIPHGPESCRSV